MDETFLGELRKALNHLYDPEALSRSPLCALLGITGSFEKPVKLQRLLEEAIQRLKPSGDSSVYTHGAQVYKFLVYRYLQQFSLKEVADELGVSQTQLYRFQQAALRDLAIDLWQKYDLGIHWQPMPEEPSGAGRALLLEKEDLVWLSQPSPERVADLATTLQDVIDLMRPVLEQNQIELTVQIPEDLPEVAVHPVALRQVLLNLINALVHFEPRGCLNLRMEEQKNGVTLQIDDFCSEQPRQANPSENDLGLQVVRQFTELSGGELVYQTSNGHLYIRLSLPALKGLPVLVIDDNPDHFELMLRFTYNTPYKLVVCPDPTQAVECAIHSQAQIVLIDVLMPKFDGWAVLQSLRSHPATVHLPVIVCSIIPMDELALSLSANAFLRKPFKQEELIAALNQWVKPSGTTPGRTIAQNQ